MSDVKSLRKELRSQLEFLGSARMIGDRDAVKVAESNVWRLKMELAQAIVKEKHAVSKADESAGKPKVVPEGGPRRG